jgi:hypothetical protein
MTYIECKKIINNSLADFCNNGGSLFKLNNLIKEYVFKYDIEPIAEDHKKILSDKAIRCILNGLDLPPNVRLEHINYREISEV